MIYTIWKELKIIFKLTSYFLSVFRIQIPIRIPYSGNTYKVDCFIVMLNFVDYF